MSYAVRKGAVNEQKMDNSKSLLSGILELNKLFDKLEEDGPAMRKSISFSEEFRTRGNQLYKQGKHNRAEHKELISLYTACISFALKDSEELAKGFANRSAVLMHLHRYKEALVDIDRALLVSKSDDFKAKLKSRRERCLKLMDKSNIKLPDELPDIQPSVKFPNASEAVDVKYSEKLGRHLVATRDIKPGEVFVAEEGYVCFPEPDQLHFVCSHCLGFAWNGIPCDTCVLTIFCSEECKNKAWMEYHDVECSIIRTMFLITNDDDISRAMIAIRSYVKAVKTEGFVNVIAEVRSSNEQKDNVERLLSNGILDSKKFKSYGNLLFQTNHSKTEDVKCSHFNTALVIVTLLHRHSAIIPIGKFEVFDSTDIQQIYEIFKASIKIIIRLIDILALNIFLYQTPFCDCTNINKCRLLCDMDRGTILAATCSLVNHSCCPNVCRTFLPGKKIAMYTITPVKKGDQLCDSYGPTFDQKKEERQKCLQERYNFLCSCQACEENWPHNKEIEFYDNQILTSPTFVKFMKDFHNYFSDQKLSYEDTMNEINNQSHPEKSLLEKAIVISGLIHKYFGYRTAYHHCLRLTLYIEMAYLKFYGENCVIPNSC